MNARTRYTHVPMISALNGVLGFGSRMHFDTPKENDQPAGGLTAEQEASMRTEFAKLHKEGTDLVALAVKENRELTAEEKTANEARFSKIKSIRDTIDQHTKFASLKLNEPESNPGKLELPTDAPGKEEFSKSEGHIVVGETKIDRAEFGRSLTRWAATGEMDRKFATITTATQSGILLPKKVLTPLATGAMNSFREGYAAYGLTPLQTIGDTSTFNQPVIDPAAGGLVAENATSETENAPTLSESIVSTVKTYQSGSVYYSNLQLAAVAFDLLNATVPGLNYNKELGLEAAMIAAMIADSGITQVVTTATATGLTYANSVSLANKLPKRYQAFKIRLLGADAYAAAEGLVDDNNRPVMVTDAQNQTLRKMHNVPTIRCDYLEVLTANKVIGLEISLVGFHFRDAGEGLARYTQVPAKPNQTGINLFGYHAYGYAVSAVAKLKTAAS